MAEKLEVGMGATMCGWTDRYAGTVISVSETQVAVQEDRATRTDKNGMSESQTYAYSPDANGRIFVFTKRKYGGWVERGRKMGNGRRVSFGGRSAYYDYSF